MTELPQEQYFSPPQRNSDMAGSAQDPAFEPHSTFMFEEPSNEEELRNMRRNIASINMMSEEGSQTAFDGLNSMPGAMGAGHEQFQHGFVNPFMFDPAQQASASWQHNGHTLPGNVHAMSTQADILSGRSTSVSHNYGQITPPDDTTPKSFTAATQPIGAAPPDISGSSAKSERARNAANSRHAKAKKARKDSVRKAETPDGEEEEEVDDRREKYREKNRLAAAKCRAKKKVNTEDLEQSAREATTRNNQLRAEERHLRDLFSSLRDQALAHDPTQGCNCTAIHAYNMHQAQKAVRGAAMGFQAGNMPSPPQRSSCSGSPSTVAASRAQSFSSMRPQFSQYPSRTQSMSNQMAFMPSTMADVGKPNYAFATTAAEQTGPDGVATAGDDGEFPEYLQQSPREQHWNQNG